MVPLPGCEDGVGWNCIGGGFAIRVVGDDCNTMHANKVEFLIIYVDEMRFICIFDQLLYTL